MSPPPPSLGAMVDGSGRRLKQQQQQPATSPFWFWAVVALATAALTAYLMR